MECMSKIETSISERDQNMDILRKYDYPNTFCFKASVTNGEFDELHKRMYELILEDIRIDNAHLRSIGRGDLKYVVRKRYRGPRTVGHVMSVKRQGKTFTYKRDKWNCQSMCVKAEATSAAVYVYLERTN